MTRAWPAWLTAHKDGTVTGLAVEVGQTVAADTEICQIKDLWRM